MMKKFLFLILLGTAACTGRKEVAEVDLSEAMMNAYWANQVSFDYLSLKGKISIESPDLSQTANINIRMKRDSVIWMSVSLVGFEGLRVLITKDSFHLINRINGTYMARSSDYFNEIIGFDAELIEIQNLMIGNAPFDQFLYQIVKDDTSSWLKGQKSDVINKVWVSKNSRTMSSRFSSDFRAEKADVIYRDYEQMGPLEIPTSVLGTMNNGVMESTAELTFSSASTDPISSFPFTVPENSRKI